MRSQIMNSLTVTSRLVGESRVSESWVSSKSIPTDHESIGYESWATAKWYQRVASHESISREYQSSESRVISKSTSTSHESIGYDSWVTSQLPSNANKSRVDRLRDPSQRVTSRLQVTINESRVNESQINESRVNESWVNKPRVNESPSQIGIATSKSWVTCQTQIFESRVRVSWRLTWVLNWVRLVTWVPKSGN